ncbi:hypothetical protein FO519_004821 [Halicephalobus sp. NKZ332]|nr:hypothetical protein FO519_004821 [Halicephalobus sp. NKZ332]
MEKLTGEVAEWLCGLPEEKLEKELSSKSAEFFKGSEKFLPEVVAERLYNMGFKEQWIKVEEKAKEVESRISKLDLDEVLDEEVEERLEVFSEFLNKLFQAFEIREEHENKKILFSHRVVLEGKLLCSVRKGLTLIGNILDNFKKVDKDEYVTALKRQKLNEVICCPSFVL